MLATEPVPASLPCWDFFDAVYCISLDSRPDRRAAASRQFAAVGLNRVEWVIASKDPEDQARGIFHSHLLCVQGALDAGARRVLVFEDDILFRRFDATRLIEACSFLEAQACWDGFFLGCLATASGATRSRAVRRIRYRCLAHAYVLNRPYAERLACETWRGIAFDNLLRRQHGEFYALSPMCGFQGLAGSDNRTVAISRLRSLFGGLPLIQLGNELYHRHKTIIILLHWLLAAAIIILLLRCWA